MDPQNYINLRRQLYTSLRRSENLLDSRQLDEAFKQVREALETIQELRRFVDERREAEFKYDLSLALQLQTQICRLREEDPEYDRELLTEALELSKHDEELKVNVIKFAINSILDAEEGLGSMPNSAETVRVRGKLVGLVGLINSAFTQTLLLIELNNRNIFQVFPVLPRLEDLSHSQLSQLLRLASRSREIDKIISSLLEMDSCSWACNPSETEQILVKMLLLCSQAGSQAVETGLLVLSRYSQLLTADPSMEWSYTGVVLVLSDRLSLQLSGLGQAGYQVWEKWLAGLISFANVFGKSKESHFALHLLTVFLKQGKFSEIGKEG